MTDMMKKSVFILLFMLLLVIAGCKKGEDISGVPESASGGITSTGLFEEDNENSLIVKNHQTYNR